MTVRLNPYLSFKDEAREAMQFYQSVFGGERAMSTFADVGMAEDPAGATEVMHSMLEAPTASCRWEQTPPAAWSRWPRRHLRSRSAATTTGRFGATGRRCWRAARWSSR